MFDLGILRNPKSDSLLIVRLIWLEEKATFLVFTPLFIQSVTSYRFAYTVMSEISSLYRYGSREHSGLAGEIVDIISFCIFYIFKQQVIWQIPALD